MTDPDVSLIDLFLGLAIWSFLLGGSLLIWLGVILAVRAVVYA